MRRGLVLEGGGLRGMFTVGVLDVWMEAGIVFDGLVGVSAGACFGCNYKSGQIGRALRYNLRYARDPRYCSWQSLLRTGDLFNVDFCYRELPFELDPFDAAAFAANPMEFHLSVTDCATGRPAYRKLETADAAAFRWIQASASMPLVSRPVEIDGHRYLDGGLSDGIPLAYFESLGYDRNVVVTTRPHGYRKAPSLLHALFRPFLRREPAVYAAIRRRHVGYNRTLDLVDRRVSEGAAVLVAPDGPLPVSRTSHDPVAIRQTYDLGRAAGERALPAVRILTSGADAPQGKTP